MNAAVFSLILASLNLGLWCWVVVVAVRDWQRFHDDRAARGVLVSLVLIAAAVGGLASAHANFIMTRGGDVEVAATVAALARGAMVAGGVAYLASLHRRHRG